jgi:diketogulonate reductase-like aldo/keto reductase
MTDSTAPVLPTETVKLEAGGTMPLLGFGTWQIKGRQAMAATRAALAAGYRHLDTATVYGNEADVGRGLSESDVARDGVFVTTKCPPNKAGQALDTLKRSLDLLGTEHVDLWLVHWTSDDATMVKMWRTFVKARETGLARDIGVSNFGVSLIDKLVADSGVSPAINQIEWSPLLFDAATVEEHRARGVALEGYSALRGGTLDDPTIGAIAESLGRTPAQVIIRWHIQHGIVVIPKSRNAERIRSNADVGAFELSAEQMATLDGLGTHS